MQFIPHKSHAHYLWIFKSSHVAQGVMFMGRNASLMITIIRITHTEDHMRLLGISEPHYNNCPNTFNAV